MKMIRVIKAKLNTEEQLSKYMNKGYSLYLDYEGKGKANKAENKIEVIKEDNGWVMIN